MGKQWIQWQTLFWVVPKSLQLVTAAMELKERLLCRKVMSKLYSILKSRDVNFAYKGPSSKSYGFSSSHVWMWVLEYKNSWELKNWCFWTLVLERTPESPLDYKETNKPILKKINPEYSWEWLVLNLKLQYFGHLIQRADSFEKTLMLEKLGGKRKRGWQNIRWLNGITISMVMSLSKLR